MHQLNSCSLIEVDITKFKCVYESNVAVPNKYNITSEIYFTVNSRTKKKPTLLKSKGINDSDARFNEAKSRAQKILAKYLATNSKHHIVLQSKLKEKVYHIVTFSVHIFMVCSFRAPLPTGSRIQFSINYKH